VTETFTVSATAAGSGNQTIPLAITAKDGATSFTVSPTDLAVNVAFSSLAASFDNTGISNESDPTSASFDTGGESYSEQQLTTLGFAPGAPFTHDGIPYTWPSAAPGSPDNVIGNGQAIEMSGQGSMLGVLGASNNGNATGPVTVIYTDGTTTTGQVTLNDWFSDAEPAPGDILLTTPNWDHSPAQGPHAVSVYAQSIPIDPTKTVADVILPSSMTQLSTANAPFHVFALGIGTPPAASSAQAKQTHAKQAHVKKAHAEKAHAEKAHAEKAGR
jgi:beta-glucosidase